MCTTRRFPLRNHIHNMKCVRSSVHYTKTEASRRWEAEGSSRVSFKSVAETKNAWSFQSNSSIELRSLIWDHSVPLSFRPICLPTKISLIFIMSVAQQGRILCNLFVLSLSSDKEVAIARLWPPSGFPGVLAKAVVCGFLFSQTRRYVFAPDSTRGIGLRY
jgi:hypothetical protein